MRIDIWVGVIKLWSINMFDISLIIQPVLAGIAAGASLMYMYMRRKIRNITAKEAETIAMTVYARLADGVCTPEDARDIGKEVFNAMKD